MEDNSIPTPKPIDEVKTAIGIDLGLKSFLVTSTGESVDGKPHYRRTQKHLARQQKRLSLKQTGSINCQKQKEKISRIHQRIASQREIFHYNVAHQLVFAV
ncbi:transposase [Microseira sp. BLCC-F43]|jgi:putative transposase|uniref:transposase n=1 Tax=Microseira sp. BLCC-F43 TaxID=3153602 RepID=UPI0035B740AE